MEKFDFDKPIEIAPEIFWVGFDDPGAGFRCNPYVMNDGNESVIFDPGSVQHFPTIRAKLRKVTKLENLKHIVVHHQDPDLCSAIPKVEELMQGIGKEETYAQPSRRRY